MLTPEVASIRILLPYSSKTKMLPKISTSSRVEGIVDRVTLCHLITPTRHVSQSGARRLHQLNLRTKVAVAIAIATLPLLASKATVDYFGNQSINQEIAQAQQDRDAKRAVYQQSFEQFVVRASARTARLLRTEMLAPQIKIDTLFVNEIERYENTQIGANLLAVTTQSALQGESLLTLVVKTGVTILLVGAIAAFLAKWAIAPVLNGTEATEKLSQAELDTTIDFKDELAALGTNISLMADQLQVLVRVQAEQSRRQEAEAKRKQLFTDITLHIRQSLNVKAIVETTVKEIRNLLVTDRVVVYRFNSDWSGTVIAESVAAGWPKAIDEQIDDPCFREGQVQQYENGRICAIDDIYQAGLTDCYIKTLEQFAVKANLVAPILRDGRLIGLLIAHHCSGPRAWQEWEIDIFAQLALQVGFALDQASLLEQVEIARREAEVVSQEQRQQKEALQLQLVEMIGDIEAVSKGDLTVRAEVTVGEIGTVADFFNAIIESLRQIVTQVKKAAQEVNDSVGDNSSAIRQLADEALKQAEEITRTLASVDQMSLSIQAVADSANQAATVARTAFSTAEAGGRAMDRTVSSILNLRETVVETSEKVKRLGESSQEISKVVSLINQIALQTNLLSINASIEAARAGEEGRGFAVVAEEVGQLAAQSAQATKEIQQIVENIQLETREVVRAMELGTTQVVEGTHLVEDTKLSLGQILDVSRQIDQLVQSISTATVSQAQTSQAVAVLMRDIAKVSESTSDSSRQVSSSLQQTVDVAQQLQASVGVFKTGSETT